MDQSSKHIYGDLVVTGNLTVGSDIAGTGDVTVTGAQVAGDQTVDTLTIDATPGAHEATPDLAFGDGDTGLYESADDTLWITTGGTGRVAIGSSGATVVGNAGATDRLITSAVPGAYAAAPKITLGDLDTGLWESADDVLKIGTAGVERVSIDSTGATFAGPITAAAGVQGLKRRVIGSGTTTNLNASNATTLGTFTRLAGEAVKWYTFLNEDGTELWDVEVGKVYLYLKRTANANEFQLIAVNSSAGARTLTWILEGAIVA